MGSMLSLIELCQQIKPLPAAEQERILHDDPESLIFITLARSLTPEQLAYFDKFRPSDRNHYLTHQLKWEADAEYFAGINHPEKVEANRVPFSIVDAEASGHHNREVYRAYYVLRFQDRVNLECPLAELAS